MAEIVSSLGFSVEDAITALTKLDSIFKSTFTSMGSALTSFNSQTNATVTAINNIAAAAKNAQSAMAGMKAPGAPAAGPAAKSIVGPTVSPSIAPSIDKIKEKTQEADKATQSWVISWKTMGRVVVTQLIVRALSQIRDALSEAVTGAVEFQTKIAEIQTIAPKIDQNFGQLGKEVANFAKQFNFPLPQAAEGIYQTISNQFTSASDRANIMAASAQLAKVAVMSLDDAVVLITGTLNAYGMASDQASTVAAKYFRTIELGQIRGSELSQVVGKVMPMAAALGVSFESVSAEMVALTIGGMRSAEASTALRGAMTALIKPSEAMKKELRELGFETAQQMIAALGLQGAFLALADSADGNVSKMAELFRMVRGLNAELRLTGPGAIKSAEASEILSKTTAESFRGIYEQFKATDAEKFTSSLNQIKVYLATELGPGILSVANSLVTLAGGAGTATAAFSGLVAAAVPVVAGLTAIAAALLVASANAKLAGTGAAAMGAAFASVVLPVSIGIGTLIFLNQKLANTIREASEKGTAAVLANAAKQEAAWQAVVAVRTKANIDQLGQLERYNADLRKANNAAVDIVKEANSARTADSRATMESMIADVQRMAGVYRAQANTDIQESRQAWKNKLAGETEYQDTKFAFEERNKVDWVKRRDYEQRARNRGEAGIAELTRATSADQADAAREKISQARTYAQTVMSLSKSNFRQEEDAERTIENLIQGRNEAEAAYAQTKANASAVSTEEAANQQASADKMKAMMPGLIKDMDLFTKKGAPKTSAEMAKDFESLKLGLKAFQGEWAKSGALPISPLLNWTAFQEKLKATVEGGVSDIEINKLFATPEAFASFRAQLQEGTKDLELHVKLLIDNLPEFKKAAEGKTNVEALEVKSKMYKDAQKTMADYEDTVQKIGTAEKAAADVQGLLGGEVTILRESFQGLVGLLQRGEKEFYTVPKQMLSFAKGADVENLIQAKNQMADIVELADLYAKNPKFLTPEMSTNFQSMIDGYKKLYTLSSNELKTLDEMGAKVKIIADHKKAASDAKAILPEQEKEASKARRTIMAIDAASQYPEKPLVKIESKVKREADVERIYREQAQRNKGAIESQKTIDATRTPKMSESEIAKNNLREVEQRVQKVRDNAAQGIELTWPEARVLKQELDDAKRAVDDLGNQTSAISPAASSAGAALQQVASVSFTGLISQIQSASNALSALSAQESASTVNAASGGVAYLAAGGKGTDTISAMLSPGEMVMNSAAAGKFATQLSAMNAGIQPTYNQESRTTNVGDITINVQGGKTGQATVREIAAGLRREVRRGTIF